MPTGSLAGKGSAPKGQRVVLQDENGRRVARVTEQRENERVQETHAVVLVTEVRHLSGRRGPLHRRQQPPNAGATH